MKRLYVSKVLIWNGSLPKHYKSLSQIRSEVQVIRFYFRDVREEIIFGSDKQVWNFKVFIIGLVILDCCSRI